MSRGTRALLGITAIALFLCCVASLGLSLLGTRLIGRAIITDPTRVAEVSNQIASYQLPPGFQETFASNLGGLKVVTIMTEDPQADPTMIMLMEFPSAGSVNERELERQLQVALAQQTGISSANMEIVSQEEATIKGEPTTLTVREGITQDGHTLRQISGLFQGNNGPSILLIMSQTDTWDQPLVEDFIDSIH